MTETSADTRLGLADVSTVELRAELVRRGFDVLPRGLLGLAVADARSDGAKKFEGWVDGTEVVRELGRIASVDFPKLVGEWSSLNEENVALCRRLRAAEFALGVLLAVAVDEICGLETESDEDD